MLKQAAEIIEQLQSAGLDPVLYGSLGASLYLGEFKQFGDVDLLVDESWISERWPELVQLMNTLGFELVDKKEHAFSDKHGLSVAFAADSILVRDGIIGSIEELSRQDVEGVNIRTLSPLQLKKAYEFSVKDGYRLEVRGKQDRTVIELLDRHIQETTSRAAS